VVEPGGDRDFPREGSRQFSPLGPRGRLDRGVEKEETMSGRRSVPPQVLEEGAFGAQDLHRARREPSEPVKAAGLGYHSRGKFRAEECRQVGSVPR